MKDNIGMCAQGNLSRLCNILSGYLDGVNAETKSRNEIIGELLAPLMLLENVQHRIARAEQILHNEGFLTYEEREPWLEPLFD